uniref:Uncharacterized protein n=1 Tax=Arundo donax TaxID=35708 RepID=A0A0A9GQH3_ARUDO
MWCNEFQKPAVPTFFSFCRSVPLSSLAF